MDRLFKFTAFFLICSSIVFAQTETTYQWNIKEDAQKIILTKNDGPILVIDSIQFNFVTQQSLTVKYQSKDSIVLTFLYENVPSFSKVNTSNDYTVDVILRPINGGWHIAASPAWARHITIFCQDLGEHYFGIRENLTPYNHKNPDLRGSVQIFEVIGEESRYFENYSSAWSAFFMTNLGYASFMNTFAYGEYKFAINGKTEIYHQTGKLDWYIFTNTNSDNIMKAYYSVIGKPKYVPAWACGPIFWRDEDKNGKIDVLADAEKFNELRIPLSAMFIDRPYSDGHHDWSKMNFNSKFSHPEEWITTLRNKYHLELMTWIGPAVFGDTFPGTFPGFYNYLDLSNPQSVNEFNARLNSLQYNYGVKGHKMDRADEFFPVSEPWFDKTPMCERRNKYIYLFSKVTDSILTARWGKDNFNFARAAMHGTQPYLSAVWGGDVRASWDGMASNLANALRCSFMGFPNWGGDVGGYLGDNGWEPEQLYRRWLQFGAWCGLFEIKIDGAGGSGNDRAPWRYGETLQHSFRKSCEERMELAPYFYSLLNTSFVNGVLMKPLAYVYPEDPNTYSIWDEFLCGTSFLVVPILNEDSVRTFYLPEGVWYNWYNLNESQQGARSLTTALTNEHIPVYVKEGSVFVTGNNWLIGNWLNWKKNTAPSLTIHIFPTEKNMESSFHYVDFYDNDSLKTIQVTHNASTTEISFPPLGSDGKILLYNFSKSGSVTINGKPSNLRYDKKQSAGILSFKKEVPYKVVIKNSK